MRADAGSLRFQILHRRLQDAPTAAAVLRRLPSPRAQRARPRPLRRPRPRPHRPPPPQRRRLPLHTRPTRLQQSVKPVSPFSVDWGAGRLMWRRQRESARSRPCMACRAGGSGTWRGSPAARHPSRAPRTCARQQRDAPDLEHDRVAAAVGLRLEALLETLTRVRPRLARLRQHADKPVHLQRHAARAGGRQPQQRAARYPARGRAPCAREGAVTRCAAARGLPRSPPPRAPKARPARSLQRSRHARRGSRLGRPRARPPAPARAAPPARPACPP